MNIDTLTNIKTLVETADEYKEFRESEKVKDKVHLLTVCGSHAYGTARPESDIDIRGVVGLDRIYGSGAVEDWETEEFKETDTVIHSYKKMIRLMAKGNPDTLALVGLNLDDYLYLSELGRQLVENHSDFLGAQGVFGSFIGYANAQLRRLEAAELGRMEGKQKLVKQKKESILDNAAYNFQTKYPTITGENFDIIFSVPEDLNDKVMIKSMTCNDVNVDNFFDVARDIKNIVSSFGDKGKRNTKKTDFKLNKHCMHTVRGMLMGIECLETGRVVTYREKDLPLLRSILSGDYMDADGKMLPDFYELVDELRVRADYAYKNTVLPLSPDMNKVSEMLLAFLIHDMK